MIKMSFVVFTKPIAIAAIIFSQMLVYGDPTDGPWGKVLNELSEDFRKVKFQPVLAEQEAASPQPPDVNTAVNLLLALSIEDQCKVMNTFLTNSEIALDVARTIEEIKKMVFASKWKSS